LVRCTHYAGKTHAAGNDGCGKTRLYNFPCSKSTQRQKKGGD